MIEEVGPLRFDPGRNKVGTNFKQLVRALTICCVLNKDLQPLTLNVEDGFALGGDLALVEAGGSTGFSENSDTAMESTGWTSDNECLDNVVEGSAKLELPGAYVSCSDMAY